MGEGRSPGEGPKQEGKSTVEQTGHDPAHYKTPVAQREQAQKEQGNPAERQAGQGRINRDKAGHRRGFPVAGHSEPERENDPGRELAGRRIFAVCRNSSINLYKLFV